LSTRRVEGRRASARPPGARLTSPAPFPRAPPAAQSLDEIKLLRYINAHAEGVGGPAGCDALGILRLHSYFYFAEHLFLVTELLKDNLYDFSEYVKKKNGAQYFTLPRLQHIARQVLTALDFIHTCGILHCAFQGGAAARAAAARALDSRACLTLAPFPTPQATSSRRTF
jgi:serine/threonine protein kinase